MSEMAIVLHQCNPSMKSQMRASAAAEASPWKFKSKNTRFFEASQVGGPPKPMKLITGSSTSTAKGRRSTSPLPSPQNQSISLASASVRGEASQSQIITDNATIKQVRKKVNTVSSENQGAGISGLQNMLVKLLKKNPRGLSIKALEKAVGGMTSNSVYKIEPILKKIATHGSSGRYILKSEVEQESLKRLCSDSGSSPKDDNQKQFVPKDSPSDAPAPDPEFAGKSPAQDLLEQVQNFDKESNMVEKFDASQHLWHLFGDDEALENNERRATRSDDNKSDSDGHSGSSDSGSDSASPSRSRSPAGSGSASSSDSDDSSNSKEASDVDVDITSDDDKEHKNLQGTEHGLCTAPVLWSMPEAMPLQDGRARDRDGYVSEDVDIENGFIDENEFQLATAPSCRGLTTEKLKIVLTGQDLNQPSNRANVTEQYNMEHEFQHVTKSGSKKRGSNVIQPEHDADHAKRIEANSAKLSLPWHLGSHTLGSPPNNSADIISEDNHESHYLQKSSQLIGDDSADVHLGMESGYYNVLPGKSAVDSLQSGRTPAARSYNMETTDKAVKNLLNSGVDLKFQKKNACTQEGYSKNDNKGYQEAQDEDSSNEKANGNFKRSPLGPKHSSYSEPHHRKHSEWEKKSHSMETSSKLYMGSSLKNNDKADFEKSPADRRLLQRELSDLELGELREPLPDESVGSKRKFESVGSFKQPETKFGTSGSRNAELKSNSLSKQVTNLGNTSPLNARGTPNNPDSLSRRRSSEPNIEDNARSDGAFQSQLQQSRSAYAEVGYLTNKVLDHSRLGNNEAVTNQGTEVEGYGETHKKPRTNSWCEDSRQETGSRKGRGSKRKSSMLKDASDFTKKKKDSSDKRNNVASTHGVIDKRRKSSLDENASYLKYEKENPELKGPIKSLSQYKDYVKEYREKYESYSSLIKILESYRKEFERLGMDLESAKGRDTERYYNILAQLRESYSQCGMWHKRQKKIFLVLHEELKHLKQMIKDFAVDYSRD